MEYDIKYIFLTCVGPYSAFNTVYAIPSIRASILITGLRRYIVTTSEITSGTHSCFLTTHAGMDSFCTYHLF